MTATSDTPKGEGLTGGGGPAALAVLRRAAFFGLLGGALELAVFVAKCRFFDPRNYNVSHHFPWIFPLAGLGLAALPGLALAALALARPARASSRTALGALAFPAYLGVLFRLPLATAACLTLAAGLSFQTAHLLAPRLAAFDRLAWRGLFAAVPLLALTWLACERRAGAPPGPATGGRRNVLLVVLDTVRAESLSLYGYPRPTTPNLERWGARGARFESAFATAPWTAPSHASLFTGRWPHEVGVGWDRPMTATAATLAGRLASCGYDTAGFAANTTYCSYETGFDRGFAHYEDYDLNPGAFLLCSSVVQRALNFVQQHPRLANACPAWLASVSTRKDAARVRRDFLNWLSGHGERPFFAFLNLFDAHHPYLSPDAGTRAPRSPADLRLLRTWWDRDKRGLDARQIQLARDAYDECLAYLDREVGLLLDNLDRRGTLAQTLVVITADHGEHLGERALYGHGASLYRSELHVPLLLIGDGIVPRGAVVRRPVSLRDVPATVADLVGAGGPSFPGRSLAGAWLGRDDAALSPVLSEIEGPPEVDPNAGGSPARRGPMRSLVAGGLHYIVNGDGREELYDLETDPPEARDLAATPRGPDPRLALARTRLASALNGGPAGPAGASAPRFRR